MIKSFFSLVLKIRSFQVNKKYHCQNLASERLSRIKINDIMNSFHLLNKYYKCTCIHCNKALFMRYADTPVCDQFNKKCMLIQILFCIAQFYIELFSYKGDDACQTCCYKPNTQFCESSSTEILEDWRMYATVGFVNKQVQQTQ